MTEKQLLEDIRHELTSLTGLYGFDGSSPRCVRHELKKPKPMDKHGVDYEIVVNRIDVPFDELIDLDFSRLIERIDEELNDD